MTEILLGGSIIVAIVFGLAAALVVLRGRLVPDGRLDVAVNAAHHIQAQRGDYNGRILSIRQEDLRTLAVIYDQSPGTLTEQLISWGVLNAEARRALPLE